MTITKKFSKKLNVLKTKKKSKRTKKKGMKGGHVKVRVPTYNKPPVFTTKLPFNSTQYIPKKTDPNIKIFSKILNIAKQNQTQNKEIYVKQNSVVNSLKAFINETPHYSSLSGQTSKSSKPQNSLYSIASHKSPRPIINHIYSYINPNHINPNHIKEPPIYAELNEL